jgi:hypothetical protein
LFLECSAILFGSFYFLFPSQSFSIFLLYLLDLFVARFHVLFVFVLPYLSPFFSSFLAISSIFHLLAFISLLAAMQFTLVFYLFCFYLCFPF